MVMPSLPVAVTLQVANPLMGRGPRVTVPSHTAEATPWPVQMVKVPSPGTSAVTVTVTSRRSTLTLGVTPPGMLTVRLAATPAVRGLGGVNALANAAAVACSVGEPALVRVAKQLPELV